MGNANQRFRNHAPNSGWNDGCVFHRGFGKINRSD
jgi:hypothetical protein